MTPKEQEQAIYKANLRQALKSAVESLGTADYWAFRSDDHGTGGRRCLRN